MNAIEKILLRLAAVALPAVLQGCGTLAAPQMLALSMASTVAGGYANGALMGGSTVGVIRNAAFGDDAGAELVTSATQARTAAVSAEAATPATMAVAGAPAMPRFANGLERACYFPNASGRGLPCS
jgi:hypothetical protein